MNCENSQNSSSCVGGQVATPQTQAPPGKHKPHGFDKPFQSYKLIIDPCLVKGAHTKLYRIDGVVQDDPTYAPVVVRDPRNPHLLSRLWKNESMELSVPRFKIDASYCGVPPPLQVTITNLNDNIDKTFLSDLLLKYGAFEEIQLFFHPVTKKHLGMAHVLFYTKRGAKYCVDKLNNTSVMGQVLNVFLDPFGTMCKTRYEELTTDKKKDPEVKQDKPNKRTPTKYIISSVPVEQVSMKVKHSAQMQVEQTVIKNLCELEQPPLPQGFVPPNSFNVETQVNEFAGGKSSPKMDLDTRIKMLLKGEHARTFGRLLGVDFDENRDSYDKGDPLQRSKLGLNKADLWNVECDDEDSVESSFAKKFKRNAFVPIEDEDQLSPPPSPFLSDPDYENRASNKLANLDLDEISDDSEAPTPKVDGNFHVGSNGIMNSNFHIPEPPLPCLPMSHIPPLPDYHPPVPAQQPYYTYYPTMNQPDPYSQYAPYPNWQAEGYMYSSYYGIQPPLPPEEKAEEVPKPELTRDEILSIVKNKIFEELKEVIRRDFQRKLIEHFAFKSYETWWNSKEKLHKEMHAKERLRQLQNLARIDLESPIGTSDIFGLGFKATIPKLPSFRIKRSPSPKHVFNRSRKTDESELESSYSEEVPRKRRRRLSLSTEESSSSEESSSEESDDALSCTSSSISDSKRTMNALDKEDKMGLNEVFSEVSNSSLSEAVPDIVMKDEPMDIPEPIKASQSDSPPSEPDELENCKLSLPLKEISPDFEIYLGIEHSYSRPPEDEALLAKRTTEDRILKVKTQNERISPQQVKQPDEKVFQLRTEEEKRDQVTLFLKGGIDEEDKEFLRVCFTMMEADAKLGSWLTSARWVDHPVTKTFHKARKGVRVNKSGSCRTEGYFKLTAEEKQKQKHHWFVRTSEARTIQASSFGYHGYSSMPYELPITKAQHICREARSNQRRLLTEFGTANESDLLKFNQLKFRKKGLRFARSRIHDWGLFAAEPIAADEMVIEYVGQIVRESVADIREKVYEKSGVVNYLFRIDANTVVDATKCGNLSRFINHSCNPNCYAKIITIEGKRKIVIYSKQQIAIDEEITYDYKFPFEDAKIKCLCGAPNCRGTLN